MADFPVPNDWGVYSDADGGPKRLQKPSKRKGPKPADLESRTREHLRALGYVYGRTETIGFSGFKKDLFGFVDGIAIGDTDILFVQTTSRQNRADRLRKMATGTFKIGNGQLTPCFDAAKRLCENPHARLVIVLWDQPGGAGTKWRCEMQDVALSELMEFRARARKVLA